MIQKQALNDERLKHYKKHYYVVKKDDKKAIFNDKGEPSV